MGSFRNPSSPGALEPESISGSFGSASESLVWFRTGCGDGVYAFHLGYGASGAELLALGLEEEARRLQSVTDLNQHRGRPWVEIRDSMSELLLEIIESGKLRARSPTSDEKLMAAVRGVTLRDPEREAEVERQERLAIEVRRRAAPPSLANLLQAANRSRRRRLEVLS